MSLTAKQIAERLTGVGSGDAAAVLGVNPYRTADDVLQEKLGLKPPFEGNEATYWGDVMEPILRKEYEKRSFYTVRTMRRMLRHGQHRFIIAHIDGEIRNGDAPWPVPGVLEIKTIRYAPKNWREHYHWVQLQHAMAAGGYSWGCLAVLVGGNEFQTVEFARDDDFITAMIELERQFWQKVLEARKEAA